MFKSFPVAKTSSFSHNSSFKQKLSGNIPQPLSYTKNRYDAKSAGNLSIATVFSNLKACMMQERYTVDGLRGSASWRHTSGTTQFKIHKNPDSATVISLDIQYSKMHQTSRQGSSQSFSATLSTCLYGPGSNEAGMPLMIALPRWKFCWRRN